MVSPATCIAGIRPSVETDIAAIYTHHVRPDMIGHGIGRRLLEALIGACEARGFRQMLAVVGDSGDMASIRLHERLGFRRVGVLRSVGYKHGRRLDSVLLQRELGSGDRAPPRKAE